MAQVFASDNLLLQLTRFIGREQELAQVRRLLTTERLVTLAGSGGVGKTRLAVELAADLRGVYTDGVWLVELDSIADPALVPLAVAGPLGVRAEVQLPVQDVLIDFLRPRHMLLVLDNCEHVVHGCAELAQALLRACPSLRILATSREPLHVRGETVWRVPSLRLPPPTAWASPDELLECDSVRLFADRTAAVAGLTLTPKHAPAAARLCQRLDGIPSW